MVGRGKKSLSVSEPVTAEYDGAVPLSPLLLKTTLWMETILSSFYIVLQKLACPRAHGPHRLRQDSSPVSKVPGPKCLTLNSSLPSNTLPSESCRSISKMERDLATPQTHSRGKRGKEEEEGRGKQEREREGEEDGMQKIDSKCTRECTSRNRRTFLTIWH